jgi:alpha-1,4-digalacturonate transport system substrate-binding protein
MKNPFRLARTFAVAAALTTIGVSLVRAQEPVELRFTWYNDGAEGDVLREQLDAFEAANPDIRVVLDVVAYNVVLEQLPLQVEAGEGPDLARITDFAAFRGEYLDLRPLLADPDTFEASFPEAVLQALRSGEEDADALYGFPNQFTVSGPYVNATLFEQAGVEIPGPDATWDDWTAAATEVAEATETPFAIAIDRSGHRFAGPAFSEGAIFFDEEGNVTIDTPGFRTMAERLIAWHEAGITPAEVWVGSGGSYAAAADFFINGQLVVYMSGSWQIGRFTNDIGDAFDWEAVPNPAGPGGSTGMPGGTVVVAFADTEHPEEVARLMEYLASADVLREFSERTLFIPGHLNLGELAFDTELPSAQNALNTFTAEVQKLSEQAYQLQYGGQAFAINNPIRDRLTQVLTGELTLDEAVERIQQDVDDALAAAAAS